MKEKIIGCGFLCLVAPLAICGYLVIVLVGLFGNPARVRNGVRALDHFVNASVLDGYAWESISSHAWRVRHEKWWASFIVRFTNVFQLDHCKRANKREQSVVNTVLKKKLHHQTVGQKKRRT